MTVSLDDLLEFFSTGHIGVPSSLGFQLDRLQYGAFEDDGSDDLARTGYTPGHLYQAVSLEEDRLIANAEVIRCADGILEIKQHFNGGTLFKVHRSMFKSVNQGFIIAGVLRAYQKWGPAQTERGLASVYEWVRSISPKAAPVVLHTEDDLEHAFRAGKAIAARKMSSDLYADALLAAAAWVDKYNRKSRKGKLKLVKAG